MKKVETSENDEISLSIDMAWAFGWDLPSAFGDDAVIQENRLCDGWWDMDSPSANMIIPGFLQLFYNCETHLMVIRECTGYRMGIFWSTDGSAPEDFKPTCKCPKKLLPVDDGHFTCPPHYRAAVAGFI